MLRPDGYTVRPVGQPEAVQRSAATGDLRQEVFQRNLAGLMGQSVQAQVLSRLTDGSFLVKVAGTPARMMLPQNAQVGSEVPLTLIGLNPRPTFQIATGNAPGSGPLFAFAEAAPPLLPGPQGSAARGEPLAYREGAEPEVELTFRPTGAPAAPPNPQAGQPQRSASPQANAAPPQVVLPPGLATLMGEDEAAPADLPELPPEDGQTVTVTQRHAGNAAAPTTQAALNAAAAQAVAGKAGALATAAQGLSGAVGSAPGFAGADDAAPVTHAPGAPPGLPNGLPLAARPERGPIDRAMAERALAQRAGAEGGGEELSPAERAAVRAAVLARAAADMAQPGPASARSAAHAAALLGKAPIIPAAYLPDIDPNSTPAQFSEGARTLTTVLAAAQGLPARTAVLSPFPLAASPDVAPQQMAAMLKDAVGKSGLFYESHVRSWAEGNLAQQELHTEPQMQRPLSQAQPGQASPLDSATAQFINLQLTTQDQGRIEWQGQVWPGQQMQWDIQRDAPRRGQNGEPDEEASTWRSGVRFSMPHLGEVHAQLLISNGQLHIQVRAGSEATRDQLRQHSRELSSAMEAAGSPLSSLDILGTGDGHEG
jgi:hypothetical protein